MDCLKKGEMAEWLKALAWKACILLKVSRVRIPFSPPQLQSIYIFINTTYMSKEFLVYTRKRYRTIQ
jgi:hypothetical protein